MFSEAKAVSTLVWWITQLGCSLSWTNIRRRHFEGRNAAEAGTQLGIANSHNRPIGVSQLAEMPAR